MGWLPDKYQSLREAMRRGDVDPDVRAELEHHIAMRIEENVAAGMSRADAEAEARRRFGDLDRYRRETKAVDQGAATAVRRAERFAVARQELRQALRALAKAKSFSVAALLTLGVGIGATTAIFTVLDAVILRPLPYPDADRLIRIYHPVPKNSSDERWNISQAEFFHFTKEAKRLDAVGLYGFGRLTIMSEGQALPVNAALVTASTLSLLGAKPRLGRLLTAEDNETRGAPAVVLSESFWRRQYGSSPSAVGAKLRIEGADAIVVGVLAAGVDLPDWPADLWVATELDSKAPARNNHVHWAIARLAPGATREAAERELADMVPGYPDRFPTAYTRAFLDRTGFTTIVVPWKDDVIGDSRRVLWVLFAAVAVVLLIAGLNVGNLFVVRQQLNRREVALRSALGADRRHLAWHHFAESGVLCFAAGLIGVGLAKLGLEALVGALHAGFDRSAGLAIPRFGEIGLGWSGVGFAVGASLVAAVAFGLGPLLGAPSPDQVLRHGGGGRGATATRRESAVRGALVVGQITFAVILLAAAGLMLRTFENLRSVQPGFDPSGVAVVDLALPYSRYQSYDLTTSFYRRLVERVKTIPGVRHAAVATDLPIEASDGCSLFDYRDRPPTIDATCIPDAVVGPEFFTTLGVVLKGRDLIWSDLDSKTGGVVLTDVLARRLWPGAGALDRAVNGPNDRTNPPYRVVGVSQDLRWRGLDRGPIEVAFFPLEPIPHTWLWYPPARVKLVAKVAGAEPAAITPTIRQFAREIDPEVAVSNPRSMEQVVARSLLRVRLIMTLLALASAVAVFLSVVGLYGVIAYLVNRRTQEIGIRIALGASAGSVRNRVVGQSLGLAAVGVVLGTTGALALTRFLSGLLFGVSPNDPVTLGSAAVALLLVATGASLVPARRATRVDPIEALRSE